MSSEKDTTAKQSTAAAFLKKLDPRTPPAVSPETTMTLAAWQSHRALVRTEQLADQIALAILRNPKVDQLLGRSPLDPGRAGDFPNAGAALAHASLRLAGEYVQEFDEVLKLTASKVPALDENGDTDRPA